MNAHTPFDANQDWSNPYCRNSSNDPMVDALLGNAYHVVRTVYCNLGNLKLLYDFLNQYGMVIGVNSEEELKALSTQVKYSRIYGFSRAGDRQVTDYLYVEGDRTGILPNDTTATGSWITVATSGSNGGGTSSGEGAYIPWVYSNGSATGGETAINVPDGTVGVPFIIVNGDMQYVGRGFEFNADNLSVTLAQPLEEGDEVVFLLTGVPAVPDNPNVNDWIQINWLYNNGAAVGGEQVIAIPYTFQSVPAVYKNGLRLYKGLTTESYTADPDNQRILLTEPLATNDRLIVQIGGEAQVLETSDHTLQEVARATNVKDSEVILSTDTTQFLNGKKIVYSVSEQKSYSLPILPTNVFIESVGAGKLVYSPGSIEVDLLPLPSDPIIAEQSVFERLATTHGASLIGMPVSGTLADAVKTGTPEMYASISADITAAIQNAVDNHDSVDMSGRDWVIERPIQIHDGTYLNLKSANITSNVGATSYLFVADDAIQKGVTVDAGGGVINGLAKSVFYFQGNTLTPTASGHYARNIRISGVYCSSDDIEHFIYMYGAVRQVFLNNCYAYVKGGMYAEGKIVEIYVNNCIWFGSGSATTSDSRITVKAIGAGYVPEGFHFTENLFDGVGKAWTVNDMYVMTVAGGYIGGDGVFGQPIALNHFINITGSECKGSIIFSPTSANDYRANIQPAIMHSKGVSGSVIIGDNANGINVTTKLIASAHPSNAGVGVVVGNGCTNIQLDLSVDQTYDRAATFNGASGARCSVLVRNYLGSSNAVSSDRPVNIISSPVTNSVSLGLVEKYENIPAGTYTVGSVMASVSINAARGKRGVIVLNMSLSGLAAGTSQIFTITVPSNLIVPNGTGWTSLVIRPQFTSGLVSMEIPFYANADIIDGSITVDNYAGNSAVVALNSYIGYRLL